MSGSAYLQQQPSGAIKLDNGANPYGSLNMGAGYNSSNRSAMFVLDRTTSAANVIESQHGEYYLLDSALGENAFKVYASATSSPASGGTRSKAAVTGFIQTSESTSGGNASDCIGVVGVGLANSTLVRTTGVSGTVSLPVSTTAVASAISGAVFQNNGASTATVGAATSTYGCYLSSTGATKPSASSYSTKASGAVNFVQGHVVDAASVDTNCFSVDSGGSTSLWSVQPSGKLVTAGANLAAPAAGAGPFAGGAASNITVSLTGLTTAAQAISAAVTVNTTAVTASSRIVAQITSYAYGAAGVMAAGCPVVCLGAIVAGTSFSFQIANVGTGALSGAIGISFWIEN